MATSLRQLARLADVSAMTVLRALRGDDNVRPELRQRIVALAEQHRYEPNLASKAVFNRGWQTLAILVPDISSTPLAEMVRGAQDALAEAGYRTIVLNSDDSVQREFEEIRQAAMRRVDGLLIVPAHDSVEAGHFEELRRRRIPVVAMSFAVRDAPLDAVTLVDDRDGYHLTRRLLALGHRRIGHIAPTHPAEAFQGMTQGWRRALTEAGIDPEGQCYARHPWLDVVGVTERVKGWLTDGKPPTAIFAAAEMQAAGVYHAAQALGLRVGEDVSVAAMLIGGAFGLRHYLAPKLSGMIEQGYTAGQLAAQRMMEILAAKAEGRTLKPRVQHVPCEWYPGGSIGAPRRRE